MDFSNQLDALEKHAVEAKSAAQAAANETRDQLKQRIDKAQGDLAAATKDTAMKADAAAADASSKWQQMKADASSRMGDMKAKLDKRSNQIDAGMAANEADWAEDDASAAIDYAEWAVDNARLAVLDAIDARTYADGLARKAAM